MVCHLAEFQQVAHAEALAGFPFVAVFVVFRERDVVEGTSTLGGVFPDTRFYVTVADVVKGFDFIHDHSSANLLVNRGLAGKDMDGNHLFPTLRNPFFGFFPRPGCNYRIFNYRV